MKRFLPIAAIVITVGLRGASADDEILEPARVALEKIGCSGVIQRQVVFNDNPPRMTLSEVQIDLKTGAAKSRRVGGECQADPLKNGVVPDSFDKAFQWDRWRVGNGIIQRAPGGDQWVPFTGGYSPADDLNYPLAKLSEAWIKLHSAITMGSAKKREANGGVLPPALYPPLEITSAPSETTERQLGANTVRKITTERGLIVRTQFIRNGVTTEITETKFVRSLDLSPPAELRELFAKSEKAREAVLQKKAP